MKKKKILLLSDDIRMHSGVATVSKDIVIGLADRYDWVQIGGSLKHPEEGKVADLSQLISKEAGLKKCYVKIYPVTGYGNPDQLREVMEMEKPDAILHFTDPRFWVWLYNMEHEIRTKIPIMYYNIWDNIPTPHYNTNYYRSSDLLMGISKQTYGINKRILDKFGYEDWQTQYIPHGINDKKFFEVEEADTRYREFRNEYNLDKYKFKILYLNRNIRRKVPGDVALAYKHFMDKLTPEQRKECVLIFHSAPIDENGTDMRTLCNTLLPDYPVIFTYDLGGPMDDERINYLYNSIDVYINMASNEGFGLGSCEAMTLKKPIIVNVTGGLQDQCGFKKEDGSYLTADDYIELESNHTGKYKEHGEWVKPVFPTNRSLQGSPATPYIFDDRCSFEDAGEALLEWYNEGPEERARCGKLGYEFVKDKNIAMDSKNMCNLFEKAINTCIEKWKKRERYTMEVV